MRPGKRYLNSPGGWRGLGIAARKSSHGSQAHDSLEQLATTEGLCGVGSAGIGEFRSGFHDGRQLLSLLRLRCSCSYPAIADGARFQREGLREETRDASSFPMALPNPTVASRADWLESLFPEGVPKLWCPALTHYTPEGAIDATRIKAHLQSISVWVKGLLVPGSTGDGWELTSVESQRVLEIALEAAQDTGMRLLVGALRPKSEDALQTIVSTADTLLRANGEKVARMALASHRVCGFAICPPRGATLNQAEIEVELSRILELGFPIALYQLPQVTQNEMSPELVSKLAAQFGNFLLFKDTSGLDTVALSGRDFRGVFLVRGMEGEYERWLKAADGRYDGFLLCAANVFAEPLHRIIELLGADRRGEAGALSKRVSAVVLGTFALAENLPTGNVFANGGKALDHFFAHGPRALQVPSPRLHSGQTLPLELLRGTGELLTRYELMPGRGYLE